MFTSGMQRRQIENDLLTLARKVDIGDVRWMQGEAFSKFVDAWHNLAHYYEQSRDTTLDAHVLKLYMRFAVALRRMSQDDHLTLRRRQQAAAALSKLDTTMDGVFRQVERNGGARTAV